ncbi:MAG: DUF4365 domain-containing protein [Acetobacter sp.]|nr:DUF4365 domain-containing protein [Acetobacter sp.]
MKHDNLLANTDIESAVSELYVKAVAAKAGYETARPDFDRDSIDLLIRAGGRVRPQIDLQLKATMDLTKLKCGEKFSYQCDRRTYDNLRMPTINPRFLVVMELPRESEEWISLSASELTLKHCAYWVSLKGLNDLPAGQSSCSVHLPVVNRFDHISLQTLMESVRTEAAA